jgi:outer membrane receptor for ferric coprogen and ferric-rhodotorulic acid
VVNALVGYQIDKNYSVSLAANNLFDRNYYATVGTFTAYNFYGEPRNLMLTFRARY